MPKNYLCSDPILLKGEGSYNINILKQIKVTKSFYTLNQEDRGCQGDKSIDDCLTREHLKYIKEKCGCLTLDKAWINNDSICLKKEEMDCNKMHFASYSSKCKRKVFQL